MTPEEHYTRAEDLIETVREHYATDDPEARTLLARAQVHATLATVQLPHSVTTTRVRLQDLNITGVSVPGHQR